MDRNEAQTEKRLGCAAGQREEFIRDVKNLCGFVPL